MKMVQLRAFDYGKLTRLDRPIDAELVRSVDTPSGGQRYCLVKLANEIAGEFLERKESARYLVVAFQTKSFENANRGSVIADIYLPPIPLPADPFNDPRLSRLGTALLSFDSGSSVGDGGA